MPKHNSIDCKTSITTLTILLSLIASVFPDRYKINDYTRFYKYADNDFTPFELTPGMLEIKKEMNSNSFDWRYTMSIKVEEPVTLLIVSGTRTPEERNKEYDGLLYLRPETPFRLMETDWGREEKEYADYHAFIDDLHIETNYGIRINFPKLPANAWYPDEIISTIMNNKEVMNGIYEKNYSDWGLDEPKYIDSTTNESKSAQQALLEHQDFVQQKVKPIIERGLKEKYRSIRVKYVDDQFFGGYDTWDEVQEGIMKRLEKNPLNVSDQTFFAHLKNHWDRVMKNYYEHQDLTDFIASLREIDENLIVLNETGLIAKSFKSYTLLKPMGEHKSAEIYPEIVHYLKELAKTRVIEEMEKQGEGPSSMETQYSQYKEIMKLKIQKWLQEFNAKQIKKVYKVGMKEEDVAELVEQIYNALLDIFDYIHLKMLDSWNEALSEFAEKYQNYTGTYTLMPNLTSGRHMPLVGKEKDYVRVGEEYYQMGMIVGQRNDYRYESLIMNDLILFCKENRLLI